jgi:hypothetical protein
LGVVLGTLSCDLHVVAVTIQTTGTLLVTGFVVFLVGAGFWLVRGLASRAA